MAFMIAWWTGVPYIALVVFTPQYEWICEGEDGSFTVAVPFLFDLTIGWRRPNEQDESSWMG